MYGRGSITYPFPEVRIIVDTETYGDLLYCYSTFISRKDNSKGSVNYSFTELLRL